MPDSSRTIRVETLTRVEGEGGLTLSAAAQDLLRKRELVRREIASMAELFRGEHPSPGGSGGPQPPN